MRRFGGIGVAWIVATVVAVTIAAAAVGSVRSEVTDVPTALGVSVSPDITAGESDRTSNATDNGLDPVRTPSSTPRPLIDAAATEQSAIGPTRTIQSPTTTLPPPAEQVDHTEHATEAEPDEDGATQDEPAQSPLRGTSNTSTSTTMAASSAPSASTSTPPGAATSSPATDASPVVTTSPTTTRPQSTAYTRIIDTVGGTVSVRVNGDNVAFRRAFPMNGWRFALGNPGPEIVEVRFGSIGDPTQRIRVLLKVVNGTLDIAVTTSN